MRFFWIDEIITDISVTANVIASSHYEFGMAASYDVKSTIVVLYLSSYFLQKYYVSWFLFSQFILVTAVVLM